MQTPTILGIDPGTKYMGIAVLRGTELLHYGVHTLRNGLRPHDTIGHAKQVVLGYLADYDIHIVAIEKPLPIATKRAAVLSVIEQELAGRVADLRCRFVSLDPREVRRVVVGREDATKIDVAEALVAAQFPRLVDLVPRRPARSALGLHPRDRYWMHMFDALAVATSAQRLAQAASRKQHAVAR